MPRHGEGTVDWCKGVLGSTDWKQSATYGVGAWLAAFALTFVILTIADPNVPGNNTFQATVVTLFEATGGHYDHGENEWAFLDMYRQMDTKFWGLATLLHFVLPAFVVAGACFLLARTFRAESDAAESDGVDDARFEVWLTGLTAAFVFGVLTLLATYAFTPDRAEPDPFRVLVAVAIYPTVIGSIGAARSAGFSLASLRATAAGVGSFVLGFFAWKFLAKPFEGNVDFGDLSGADQWLPFLGTFIADHGAYITPGQGDFLGGGGSSGSPVPTPSGSPLSSGPSLPPGDLDIVGSTGPELFLFLGPLLVAGGLVYYDDVYDPLVAAGHGARVALGYFAVTAVLTIAVLGQRMNYLYDELYGTGSEEAVRDLLFQEANLMFGAILPQVLLVVGVLTPILLGAVGGVLSAKVQTGILGEGTAGAAEATSGGGAEVPEPSASAEADDAAEVEEPAE